MTGPCRRLLCCTLLGLSSLFAVSPREATESYIDLGWAQLSDRDQGWQVTHVREKGKPSTPLEDGDLIISIEGQDVSKLGALSVASLLMESGLRPLQLLVRRNAQERKIMLAPAREFSFGLTDFLERYGIGAEIWARRDPPAKLIGDLVAGGPAEKAGLQKGDELVAIDRQETASLDGKQVQELLVASHPGPVRLRIRRQSQEFELVIPRVATRQLYGSGQTSSLEFPSHRRGQPAPAFTLPDTKGSMLSLEDLRGRWVLLNFWATWCAPCRAEIPLLKEWTAQCPDKVVILGLSIDDDSEQVQKFLAQTPLPYRVLIAGNFQGATAAIYGVRGIPLNVLIRPDGSVAYVECGFHPPSHLEVYLRSLMAHRMTP